MRITRLHAGRRRRRRHCAVVAAGCGTTSGDDESDDSPTAAEEQGGFTAPDLPMPEELGEGEGELNVLAWPGLRRGRLAPTRASTG